MKFKTNDTLIAVDDRIGLEVTVLGISGKTYWLQFTDGSKGHHSMADIEKDFELKD